MLCQNLSFWVVLIILISRFVPYRVCIFVSERRSIAGYVTERTDEKTHARGCKATIRIFRTTLLVGVQMYFPSASGKLNKNISNHLLFHTRNHHILIATNHVDKSVVTITTFHTQFKVYTINFVALCRNLLAQFERRNSYTCFF